MEYSIEDLIKELLEDKDWDLDENLKKAIVPGLGWSVFEK